MTDHSGRIILVTGASRGIGYAAAKQLAVHGAHVIAIARTQGGLEDLDDDIKSTGGQCTLVPMDLKDGDSIDRLGKALHERFGKLDGLLLNAAQLGDITPLPHIAKAVPGEDASTLPDPIAHWENLSRLLSAEYDQTGTLTKFKG